MMRRFAVLVLACLPLLLVFSGCGYRDYRGDPSITGSFVPYSKRHLFDAYVQGEIPCEGVRTLYLPQNAAHIVEEPNAYRSDNDDASRMLSWRAEKHSRVSGRPPATQEFMPPVEEFRDGPTCAYAVVGNTMFIRGQRELDFHYDFSKQYQYLFYVPPGVDVRYYSQEDYFLVPEALDIPHPESPLWKLAEQEPLDADSNSAERIRAIQVCAKADVRYMCEERHVGDKEERKEQLRAIARSKGRLLDDEPEVASGRLVVPWL